MDQDTQRWHAHQAALYLDHVRGMGVQIVSLTWAIEALEAKAEGVGAIRYDKDQVSTSPTDEAMPNNVSELVRQKREREHKRELYETELAAVSRAFERMPNEVYSGILESHYIGEKTWKEIGKAFGYSKPGIMRARQRALAMFYDYMPPTQRFREIPKAL